MPIGFIPANLRYGKNLFPAQPEETGLTAEMQGNLLNIMSGMPQFDPASSRFSPIPPSKIMSPTQRAMQTATGPGEIGGGLEGTAGTVGLPFAAQIGLGTGGPGQGQRSSTRSPGIQPSPTSPVSPAPSTATSPAPASNPAASRIATLLSQLASGIGDPGATARILARLGYPYYYGGGGGGGGEGGADTGGGGPDHESEGESGGGARGA